MDEVLTTDIPSRRHSLQTVARPADIAQRNETHCIPYLKPKLDNGMAAVAG